MGQKDRFLNKLSLRLFLAPSLALLALAVTLLRSSLIPGPSAAPHPREANGPPSRPRRWPGKSPSRCERNASATLGPADFLPQPPRVLHWTPRPRSYLLPLCQYGRMSNQQLCMRKYFWYAALLDRSLVIPRLGFNQGLSSDTYSWRWDALLPAPHMRRCLAGSDTLLDSSPVLSLDELLRREGKGCLQLDRVFALLPRGEPIFDAGHQAPGVCPWEGEVEVLQEEGETVSLQRLLGLKRTAVSASVISLGTAFYEVLEGHDTRDPVPPFPLQADCGDFWAPDDALTSLSASLVEELSKGRPYAAVHLRRGDFSKRAGEGKPYPTIPEVATTLAAWVRHLPVSVLYVATDGSEEEKSQLKDLLQQSMALRVLLGNHQAVEVENDPRQSSSPLDVVYADQAKSGIVQKLGALEMGPSELVLAAVEKLVCSGAAAFMGTPVSTYSEDIMRMRIAGSRASCWDTQLFDEGWSYFCPP